MSTITKLFTVNNRSLACSPRFYTAFNSREIQDKQQSKNIHVTQQRSLPQAAPLKLPNNVVEINSAETGMFSPLRSRDLSGPVINAHSNKMSDFPKIDITLKSDPHVASYDCRGAVSLSSSMQSNVPSPFGGSNATSHLGMPGGQWGQGYKYLSDHLNSSHYLTLRNEYRNNGGTSGNKPLVLVVRSMSSAVQDKSSYKERLKSAVKEYGSTVIVFHVTISLASLAICYLVVSSGIDPVAILERLNMGGGKLSSSFTANASTFVIAYAFHKMFAPVRMGITLTATPFIVKYLRKIGFLKHNAVRKS